VQQRAGVERAQLGFGNVKERSHLRGVKLGAAHVTMSRLVLGVDGDGERLDRVHVYGRHFFGMLAALGFGMSNLCETSLVEVIEQIDERKDE
jgi:hypothetical protein